MSIIPQFFCRKCRRVAMHPTEGHDQIAALLKRAQGGEMPDDQKPDEKDVIDVKGHVVDEEPAERVAALLEDILGELRLARAFTIVMATDKELQALEEDDGLKEVYVAEAREILMDHLNDLADEHDAEEAAGGAGEPEPEPEQDDDGDDDDADKVDCPHCDGSMGGCSKCNFTGKMFLTAPDDDDDGNTD